MKRVVGIDLGTSTSEVAILKNGKPFVIPNLDGQEITPSVVGIDEDGKIIVGSKAKEQMILRPKDTVIEVKRLMGSDSIVRMGKKAYAPHEISSYILKYLIESANEYLGEKIDSAVISVPAYFTDKQRKETLKAGELAGIKIERIINEPTAASLDYGIDHMEEVQNILIYDLGGGTLDVTVLEMFDGVLEVKASSGDNKLGGKDFDDILMKYIIDRFAKTYNKDITKVPAAMYRIKLAAEECKIALSTEESANISLPFIETVNGKPVSIDEKITREMFENMINSKIEATQEWINIALKDAKLANSNIDLVLLVGGSTRIPAVKKFVQKIMGKEPKNLLDPDLAVVRGASIQAAIIAGELSSEQDIMITDVCPYTLGISTTEFNNGKLEFGMFSKIIPRNTTIPCSLEREYAPLMNFQTKCEIEVYQGENKIAIENNFLGKFFLDGIPAAFVGEESFVVNFTYDLNGILEVKATVKSTKKSANIRIETNNTNIESKKVNPEKWKEAPKAKKYKVIINKAIKILNNNKAGKFETELSEILKSFKISIVKDDDEDVLDNIKSHLSDILLEILED